MVESNLAKDESFGIIPIWHQNDTYLFLLIQHQKGHWGFPKGHAEPGESALETACRELFEETGISDFTVVEEVSFSEQYIADRKGQIFDKTVTYFPGFVQSTTVKYQEEEIQAYTWADYETAIALITYDTSKQTLRAINQYLTTLPRG